MNATGMTYEDAMSDAVSHTIDRMGYREVAEMIADWKALNRPGEFTDWQRERVWLRLERETEKANQSYFEGFE